VDDWSDAVGWHESCPPSVSGDPRPPAPDPYDAVPYTSRPIPQTHPDALATAAYLAGLDPAPVSGCRVLELGCGEGVNLLAMAVGLPGSRFLGIDRSGRQIALATALASELALPNIEFQRGDIAELGQLGNAFDYVVCHGVYSWCPRHIQDAILSAGVGLLARHGVFYLSYNTYPGWHRLASLRWLMRYGADEDGPWEVRVANARRYLSHIAGLLTDGRAYATQLKEAVASIWALPDCYLFHEFLEPENEPIYFADLARRAAEHGLCYLGESRLESESALSVKAREAAKAESRDPIDYEQNLDFLIDRTFRRSLFVHEGAPVDWSQASERLLGLRFSTDWEPVAAAPSSSGDDEFFLASRPTRHVKLSEPLLAATLRALARARPAALTLDQLVPAVRGVVGPGISASHERIVDALVRCRSAGVVVAHVWSLPDPDPMVARPAASPLARAQARSSNCVANLLQQSVCLTDLERDLIQNLDGMVDRSSLAEIAAARLSSAINLTFPESRSAPRVEEVERALCRLRSEALLMA